MQFWHLGRCKVCNVSVPFRYTNVQTERSRGDVLTPATAERPSCWFTDRLDNASVFVYRNIRTKVSPCRISANGSANAKLTASLLLGCRRLPRHCYVISKVPVVLQMLEHCFSSNTDKHTYVNARCNFHSNTDCIGYSPPLFFWFRYGSAGYEVCVYLGGSVAFAHAAQNKYAGISSGFAANQNKLL